MKKDQWKYLGSGTFNQTYIDPRERQVLKIQRLATTLSDSPERSVRVWMEVNPHLSPPAKIYQVGWVCPFVRGSQATDIQMRDALIDIFNLTGRIVVDAPAPGNFLTTDLGEVVCVDIGMAFRLEEKEVELCSGRNHRRKSIISLDAWNNHLRRFQSFQNFFRKSSRKNPQTVDTIKALLFIKKNRPEIINVDFLKGDLKLTKNLARAYELQYESNEVCEVIKTALKDLDKAEKLDRSEKIKSIKENCRNELNHYIKSRGTLNSSGIFSSSLMTRIFRNEKITEAKIRYIQSLIGYIHKSSSIKELRQSIALILKIPDLEQATFNSGLMRSIKRCDEIISTAVKQMPELAPEDEIISTAVKQMPELVPELESSNSSFNLSAS